MTRKLTDWRTYELPAKLAADAAILFLSFLAALALRFDGDIPSESSGWFLAAYPLIAVLYLAVHLLFGVYRRWWRYASLHDAVALAESIGTSTAILFIVDIVAFPARDFPLSAVIVGGIIALPAMGSIRLRSHLRRRFFVPKRGQSTASRILIAGAGRSGQMLAHELLQHREWQYKPVCFVDDDPRKQGLRIHGLRVAGTRRDIPSLVEKHRIDVVAIAIPSAPGPEIRELVTIGQTTRAKIQIVPGIPELMEGRVETKLLRELTVTDLLGRQTVEIDFESCRRAIQGKVVLVTGAAGSIGQELCRQLLHLRPRELVALDNNESGLYELEVALAAEHTDNVRSCVGDIGNRDQIERVFESFRPQVVFHAAAFKHVPLMETHAAEAYRVNLLGTHNVLVAAERCRAERVTFVSTDKAVNPCNVMGATKRLGELLVMAMGSSSATSFCAVRFGNVIGTRGSVVPTFRQQIEAGGPVTVTDSAASRFFMTVDEAASLIVQATAFASNGEIFMLDMGEEIKIVDLAHKMIRLNGLRPGVDIEIVFTGLRSGEKIREELVGASEVVRDTNHPKVKRVISRPVVDRSELINRIDELGRRDVVSKVALLGLLDSIGEKAAAGAVRGVVAS